MKKVFYLLTLSLIFIYGCSKDDSSSLDLSQQDLKFKSASITFDDLQSRIGSKVSSKSEDSGANGHFSTQEGNTTTFSSGDDGEFGNWNVKGVVNFKADVICATVEGNRAVVQVVITKVGAIPEGAEASIAVGYTHLFLVEDNGEGSNAPRDRYWDYSLFIPAPFDFCFGLGAAEYLEIFESFGVGQLKDTAKKSDQIQVR